MKARIVDLRYKMKEVLKALERNEEVTILYHGKVKGVIVSAKQYRKDRQKKGITEHPFFGMRSNETGKSVQEILEDLRRPRFDDI